MNRVHDGTQVALFHAVNSANRLCFGYEVPRAREIGDMRTEGPAELDGDAADAAGRPTHERGFLRPQTGLVAQGGERSGAVRGQ